MKLQEWVKQKRGRNLAVAQLLGVTPPVVSDWCMGKKTIAAEHCKSIQQFTAGQVTCQEMRPDDWHKYWPELDQAPAVIAQAATETVAPEAIETTDTDTGALRAGTVRRHGERRVKVTRTIPDQRQQNGPPFQSLEKGVA